MSRLIELVNRIRIYYEKNPALKGLLLHVQFDGRYLILLDEYGEKELRKWDIMGNKRKKGEK